jgi:lipoprotein-releasing system permease protein
VGFEGFLAWRYLKPKRRRGFINLITLIALAGVAISVTGLIVVVSVMNGFDQDIRDKIIGTNAHVLVNAYGRTGLKDWPDLLNKIRQTPRVVAAAPFYQGQAMLKSADGVLGVVVEGILPKDQAGISKLGESIKQGSLESLDKDGAVPGALLGRELADNLNLRVGDELTLFSPVFHQTPLGPMPRVTKLKVTGLFQTGFYEYDSGLIYVSLVEAQKLFDSPGAVTQIGVRVEDLDKAGRVASEIQSLDPGIHFWARDWLGMHHNLFTALQTEKLIMFIILACMIVVAAFNIVSTLIMVVMEKQKEIGILKSLGAAAGQVLKIFVYEGLVIGLGGTVLGFLLGLGICTFIAVHPIHIPGGGSVYYIENLPVSVKPWDLAIIFGLSLMACFVATLYPSWKASRLDPVEAIRYE